MRVLILVDDFYEEMEMWYPYYRILEENIEVIIAAPGGKKEYLGKNGYPVKADMDTTLTKSKDFHGVIIPGGYAPDKLRRYPEILQFIREMNDAGKLIASICHGPWVLISAGILSGRRATCFHSIKDDLVNAGAFYLDEETVVDNNIITARVPGDLPSFCREIISFLRAMELDHGTPH